MKFTVERNWIDVVGRIWMPPVMCAMQYNLSAHDLSSIGEPTQDNVQSWLDTHAGDFQSIEDFHAIIGETEINWQTEESESIYNDCMCPEEI